MNCVFENPECNHCGECEKCDLDATKRCDNCCTCINNQSDDMRTIIVRKDKIEAEKLQVKRNIVRWKPQQK